MPVQGVKPTAIPHLSFAAGCGVSDHLRYTILSIFSELVSKICK